MALKKEITGRDEQIMGYWRVEETRILNKNNMMVCVRAYPEPTSTYWLDERCFDKVPHVISEKNAWEQAYEYLKSLPEFAGAVDC